MNCQSQNKDQPVLCASLSKRSVMYIHLFIYAILFALYFEQSTRIKAKSSQRFLSTFFLLPLMSRTVLLHIRCSTNM